MIRWQPPQTAPKDSSYFAVLTVMGDLEGWIYEPKERHFRVLHIPGGGQTIKNTTATIAKWTRWSQVFDLIRNHLQHQ